MYDKDRLMVHIQERFEIDGFELFLHTPDSVATMVTMAAKDAGHYPPSANLVIDREAATRMMEQLWNYGIRPADARYKSETVSAMKEHITDLKKIAFKLLKLEG